MGLFDFFKKKPADAPPAQAKWESLDAKERVTKIVLPLLARVASRAGIEHAEARPVGDFESAELVGALDGLPCRVLVTWSGGVELHVRYDEELAFLDLEYDPEIATNAKSWDKNDRRVPLAPGLFRDDNLKARAAFDALPADLHTRIVEGIPRHRIRYFRSRPSETTIDLYDDLPKLAAPEETISTLLRLAVDTAKARGATTAPLPGAPVDPAIPFAGWVHLGQEEKWERVVAFAETIAKRVGGKARLDLEEREIEVRWTEGGVTLRIFLDLGFLFVQTGALARGVEGTLDVFWDPKLVVREDITSEVWDPEDYVFLAPSIVLRGEENEVRAQMALVAAVPDELLGELYATMARHRLKWVNLDEGLLDTRLPDWPKTDDGTTAIEVARLFGRIAKELPRGKSEPIPDRVVRCKFCRALWFPSAQRAACTQCGAPA